MEFKINKGAIDLSSRRKRNDIFRRFRQPFSALTSRSRNRQHFPDLDKVYVINEDLHDQLDDFVFDKQNIGQFIIGLTGIGKTTTIKGYFGIDGSTAKIIEDTLLLSVFVDGAAISKESDIGERLASLFWNGCKELDSNLKYNDDDLYDYIYGNSPQTLGRFESPNNTDKSITINELLKHSRRSFYLELLKLYLKKNEIKNIIIIIDDIDSIKNKALLSEFVHIAAKSWECLQNNDSETFIKLLISERPETHQNLFCNADWFTAFGFIEEPIDLCVPPDLSIIFKNRFDFLVSRNNKQPAKDMQEWKIAYDVLIDICNDISNGNQDVLLSLCNYNVRDAFGLLMDLLTAGFWLQKYETLEPYFRLRKHQFRKPSNILVLKSIGYKNNDYYINSKKQVISNLIHYRRGCSYPLLTLHIVRAFLVENEKHEGRFIVVEKDKLLSKLKTAITPRPNRDLNEAIEFSMKYLLSEKVLLISSLDSGNHNKIYLSPKGEILWALLGKNSILLELFRDDMWLDTEKNRSESIRLLPLDEKFREVIKLSQQLIYEEKSIINDLIDADSLYVYQELFGDELVSTHVSNGVLESIRRFYNSDNDTTEPESIIKLSEKLITESNNLIAEYLEV